MQCVTLCHNLTVENVQHPYFGTESIAKDLEKLKGFQEGLIHMRMNWFVRNKITK